MEHAADQQHPIGVYLKIWALLFVLSAPLRHTISSIGGRLSYLALPIAQMFAQALLRSWLSFVRF